MDIPWWDRFNGRTPVGYHRMSPFSICLRTAGKPARFPCSYGTGCTYTHSHSVYCSALPTISRFLGLLIFLPGHILQQNASKVTVYSTTSTGLVWFTEVLIWWHFCGCGHGHTWCWGQVCTFSLLGTFQSPLGCIIWWLNSRCDFSTLSLRWNEFLGADLCARSSSTATSLFNSAVCKATTCM